jgi:hypothetical protein
MTFERLPIDALGDPSHAYTVVQWLLAPGWSHERDHVSEIWAWGRGQRTAQAGRRLPGRTTVASNRRRGSRQS